MFQVSADDRAIQRSVQLKDSLNMFINRAKDCYGFVHLEQKIPGWDLEVCFPPQSSEAIAFVATNSNSGVYFFELDKEQVEQGRIVLKGDSNATAKILLAEWFKGLVFSLRLFCEASPKAIDE